MSATFQIMIKADPTGARSATRQVQGDLEKVKQKALEVNQTIRRVFGIFAIRELAGGLYDLVEGYTNLQNKLRNVARDQANLNGLTEATYRIAQETRSSWAATATMYQRMAQNSRQLGVSQQDLLDFTKELNQAIIVGHATGTEAAAGLLQLSQGMASGALKGDELRAVLEQLPVVADVIGKKMGATRGELRQLGTEGKITGRIIVDAFKEAAPELEKQFGRTIPTMGQGFEMLRNSAMRFFGAAGTGSGVLQGLAEMLIYLADHMETIGKVVIAAAQAFLGLYVIKTVISLFQALTAVILANPLTAFIVLVTTGIMLLRQFGDQMETDRKVMTVFGETAVTIGDYLRAIWEQLGALGDAIWSFLGDAWQALTGAFSEGLDSSGIELSFENVLKIIASFVYAAIGIVKRLKDIYTLAFGGIPVILAAKFDAAFKGVVDGMIGVVNRVIYVINRLIEVSKGVRAVANLGDLRDAKRERDRLNAQIRTLAAQQIEIKGSSPLTDQTYGDQVKFDKLQAQVKDLQAKRAIQETKLAALRAEFSPVDTIPEIDIDRPALAGAADAFKKQFHEIVDGVRGEVEKGLEDLDRIAAENAKDRKVKSTIDKARVYEDPLSKFEAPGPSKAQQNALARKLRMLDSLMKKSNDVTEAEMKLAAAEKLLADPEITAELKKRQVSADVILTDYTNTLKSALDPIGTWINKTTEATDAMKGTAQEYEHNKAVAEELYDLQKRGITLNDSIRRVVEQVTRANEERAKQWEIEKGLLEEARGPYEKYLATLKAIAKLKASGDLTPSQAGSAFRETTSTFTKSNDDEYEQFQKKLDKLQPVREGFRHAMEDIQKDLGDLSTAFSEMFKSAFESLNQFILDSVSSGVFAFDDLKTHLIAALNQLALKIIEQYLLMKLLGSFGGPTPSFFGPMGRALGIGADGVAGSGVTYGGAHATGGDYTVPGSGGPDSRHVLFRLTPGEHVQFTPPGRSPESGGSSQAPARAPQVHVHNHYDRNELLSVLKTSAGDTVVTNVIRKNKAAIKSILEK